MKTIFKVPMMSCDHCKQSIKGELSKLSGVNAVIIDLDAKTVDIDHDPSVTKGMLITAIDNAGFDVEQTKN